MRFLQDLIRRHPAAAYFVLTFALSWGFGLAGVGGTLRGTPDQVNRSFLPLYLGTIAGPPIASLVVTFLARGREGLRDLGSRLVKWRVGAQWYAAALLITPVTVFGTLLFLSTISPVFLPGVFSGANATLPGGMVVSKPVLLSFCVGIGVLTGFCEELGWTGVAAPELLKQRSFASAGAALGLIWGAWHFFANYWALGTANGAMAPAIFLPAILFSFLPPYRVLMVWVYDHTGSLLVAMVMHASLVASWLASTPAGIGGVNEAVWYVAWGAVLWGVALVVTWRERAKGVTPALA